MEAVKAFNAELSSLYEARPPISKAKMTAITRTAIKAIKFYKHVVQSVEKFIQKCKPEYKVPGLYVIDSIVRQSRHQFSPEKDVFAPRFARNIQQTFMHLFNCPTDDKGKIVRVLNLWQKNQVFTPDVVQPLLDLASKDQLSTPSNGVPAKTPPSTSIPVKPDPSWLAAASESISSAANKASSSIDSNIAHQLQNLQSLLLEKKDSPGIQTKKDEVKFDKKLLDFDYDDDEDEPSSPLQSQSNSQPQPLPSIDSLQTILSNPEVLRQLQNLQHQMSSRQQQQAEMEDKMRRLQEMRHQEEEFDKHLAQTLPNLPFAAECDFKPSSVLSSAPTQLPEQPAISMAPTLAHPTSSTAPVFQSGGTSGFRPAMEPTNMDFGQGDYDERSRLIRGNLPDINVGMGGGNGGGINDVEIIDLISGGDSTGRSSRSPSRSTGRRRDRRSSSPRRSRRSRSRSGSRSRSRRSRRSRSRDRERDKEDREKEKERRRRGLPLPRKNHISVCSTTLWVGHLSKLVQQEELSDTFGEFGDIVSINLIPPRGCAFVVMNRRQDAFKALQQLKQYKLQGKAITLAWAPSKGMKDKEWKDYWEVEEGASFIPWYKLSAGTDFRSLEEGGMIDEDTMPDWLKNVKRDQERSESFKQQQIQQMVVLQQSSQLQSQSQMVKDPKEDNIPIDQNKGANLNDNMSALPPPGAVPGFIPIPDATLGPPPGNQAAPITPSMVIPPFAIPPNVAGLLGPMGPMGHLGMGNVPLAVPPPMMMPPQGMRLPFNPQGLMGPPIGPAVSGPDKGLKNNEAFPGQIVPPFGLPMGPLSSGPNVTLNNMGTKGPSEMDVEETEDVPIESKENNLNNGQRGGPFGQPSFGPPQLQGPSPFNNDNGHKRDTERRQSQSSDTGPGDKQKNDSRDLNARRGRDKDRDDRDWDRDRDRRYRDGEDDGLKRRRRDSPGRGGPPGPHAGKDMDRRGRNRGDWNGPKGRPKWDQNDDRARSSISPFREMQGFGPGHDGPSPMKDQRPPLLPLPDQHFPGRPGFGGPPGPQGPPRGGFGPMMSDDDDDRRLPPDFHHGGPPDFHHGGGGGNPPPDFMGPPDFHPEFHGGLPSDFHEFRGGEPPGFQDGPPDFSGDFPPRMFFGRGGPHSQRGMGPRGGGPRNSNGPFGPPRGPPGHMGMRGPPPRQGPGLRMGPPGGPGPRAFMPIRLRGGPRFQANRRWDDFPPLSPGVPPPERERLPFERSDSRPPPPFQSHHREWDKGSGGGGERGGRAPPPPRRPREDRKSRWSSAPNEHKVESTEEPTESGESEMLPSVEQSGPENEVERPSDPGLPSDTRLDNDSVPFERDSNPSEYREDVSEPYQPDVSEIGGESDSAVREVIQVDASSRVADKPSEISEANECGGRDGNGD